LGLYETERGYRKICPMGNPGCGEIPPHRESEIMDRAREMVKHYRQTVERLDQQASEYETAKAVHLTGGIDDSKIMAEDLRHKARNLESVIAAGERFTEGRS
jgi:hypothetical protein